MTSKSTVASDTLTGAEILSTSACAGMAVVGLESVEVVEVRDDRELVGGRTTEDIGAHAQAPKLRDLRRQRAQQRHPVLPLCRR